MKRFFSFLLTLALLISALPFSVLAEETDLLIYTYDSSNHTATVSGTTIRLVTNVSIPESVEFEGETYTVTAIDDEAFFYCDDLESISIPDSVTSIGEQAFYNCEKLASIEIPDSVTTIGTEAFYLCASLSTFTIPASVTSIGDMIFRSCRNLTDINVDADNANYISEDGVLFSKDKKTLICYPEKKQADAYVIPDTVITVDTGAFFGCYKIDSIEIPDSVITIGDHAFKLCSAFENLVIPDSVTSIGSSAFSSISMTSVTIGNSVETIGAYAFSGCSSLKTVVISDSVISIGSGAFSQCTLLSDVTIGSSVITIGDEAFYACDMLKIVNIPESVKSIGTNAFYRCNRVTSFSIPASVTTIGEFAFDWCENLTVINVDPNNANYCSQDGVLFNKDKTVLISCPSNKTGTYTIPDSVIKVGNKAFDYCISLTGITISDSVTTIGNYAFAHCESITAIEIPDSVTTIDEYAFFDCISLINVAVPDSVTSLGNSVFSSCTSLKTASIGNSITTLSERTFTLCESLTSVSIGSSVTTIDEKAFYECDKLLSVVIPKSVKTINAYAFSACSWLHTFGDVYYEGTEADRKSISIGYANVALTDSQWHYGCAIENGHVYSNACDADCDACSALRTAPHNFENDYDEICSDCTYVREIQLPEISAVSVTLSSDIAYNVKVSGNISNADASVSFIIAGKQYTVTDYKTADGVSVFTLNNIAPHLMTENIKVVFTLSSNGTELCSSSYDTSIEQYCIAVASSDVSYKPLVDAVLGYGAAAQVYNNYRTDTLANRSLTEAEKVIPANSYDNIINKSYYSVDAPLADWKSIGLVLDSNVDLRPAFETTEDINDLSVKVESLEGETIADLSDCFTLKDGKYLFGFDVGISELDTVYLFTVYKNGEAISDTLSCNVESYAALAVKSDDSNLVSLIHALMNYGSIAKNY